MSDRARSEEFVDLVGEDGRRIARWLTRPEAELKARELEEATGEPVRLVAASAREIDKARASAGGRS